MHPRNGGRFPPTLNYCHLWLLVYIEVFRFPSLSFGKPVHSAAVQVWLFLWSRGNVNTVGDQLILAYEIRGAQHAEGHIHRDRNMLWIQGSGEEGSCAVNPVHWICLFRLIHPQFYGLNPRIKMTKGLWKPPAAWSFYFTVKDTTVLKSKGVD